VNKEILWIFIFISRKGAMEGRRKEFFATDYRDLHGFIFAT
jgi:hypothetical protein